MPRPTLIDDLWKIRGVKDVHITSGYGWFEALIDGGDDFALATTIIEHTADGIETRGNQVFRAPKTKLTEIIIPKRIDAEGMFAWLRDPDVEQLPTGSKVLVAVRFSRPPKPPTVIEVTCSWYVKMVSKIFVALTELHPWFKG